MNSAAFCGAAERTAPWGGITRQSSFGYKAGLYSDVYVGVHSAIIIDST